MTREGRASENKRLSRAWALGLAAFLILSTTLPAQSAGQSGAEQATGPLDPFAALESDLSSVASKTLGSVASSDPRSISVRPSVNDSTEAPTEALIRRAHTPLNQNAISRVKRLQPLFDPILRDAGIPESLAAVVLVESGGNPDALSPKGARGLWQLMPDTARRYGLEVDREHDERLDILKSTRAAADYLSDLFTRFHDWRLALAAYNVGEQNLNHAIEQGRSQQFAVLSFMNLLPTETRNYVPAVLGAMPLFGGPLAFDQSPTTPRTVILFALSGE